MPHDLKKNMHLMRRTIEGIKKNYQRDLLEQRDIKSEIESSLTGIISRLNN